MKESLHSLRCPSNDEHPPHEWNDSSSGHVEWWCMGTDPIQAIAAANATTIDGTPIRFGLAVIDYNRDTTAVVAVQSVHAGVVWFACENGGMFDGTRLWAVK